MKLEKISNSKAYKPNPKIHNQKYIFEIARLIKEFVFTNPILFKEGTS